MRPFVSQAGDSPTNGPHPRCTPGSCTDRICNVFALGACYPGYQCGLSCTLVAGSKVCSNSHTTDCTTNADCAGGGTCSDLPAADYVLPLVGINDWAGQPPNRDECNVAGAVDPSCPPVALPTPPAATPVPTPGFYGCPRVACSTNADCTSALGTGSYCGSWCSSSRQNACVFSFNCPAGETCPSSPKYCTCPCNAVHCATDADCGPGPLKGGRGTIGQQYGSCVAGRCTNCGPPACSGTPQWEAHHRRRNPFERIAVRNTLRQMILDAGRLPIELTAVLPLEGCNVYGENTHQLKKQRELLLRDAPNVVDVWLHEKHADQIVKARRCSNDAAILCTSNADCTASGATCVTYPSTLRPYNDHTHPNALGAAVIADRINDYLTMLSPVCTGDPTTGCGRCSTNTGTACLSSADCPAFTSGEKCLHNNAVCSGAGKGTCRAMRACNSPSNCATHSLCTLDLATRCTSDGDCTGKGVCRPEGLLAVGEG